MKFEVDFAPTKIILFRNGELHYTGYSVVITHHNFKNWEQFILYVSQHINLQSGAVRRIYSLNGQLIHEMRDFEDGNAYVCSAGEEYIKIGYSSGHQHALTMNEKSIVKIEKQGTFFDQESKGLCIYAVLNESIDTAKKIILNYRNCKNLEQLLSLLTVSLHAKEPISQVINSETKSKIVDMSEVPENAFLVACTRHFTDQLYKFPKPHEAEIVGSKIITVFPNGDAYHVGVRLTITSHKFKSFDKVLDQIATHLKDKLPRVTVLYGFLPDMASNDKSSTHKGVAFSPKHVYKIKELSELLDGHYYVAGSSTEPFRNIRYNIDSIEQGLKTKLLSRKTVKSHEERDNYNQVEITSYEDTKDMPLQNTSFETAALEDVQDVQP